MIAKRIHPKKALSAITPNTTSIQTFCFEKLYDKFKLNLFMNPKVDLFEIFKAVCLMLKRLFKFLIQFFIDILKIIVKNLAKQLQNLILNVILMKNTKMPKTFYH